MPLSATVGASILFTSNLSPNFVSVLWDFGDAGSSTDFNPAHIYAAPGVYTVTLTATDAAMNDVEFEDIVTIVASEQDQECYTEPEETSTLCELTDDWNLVLLSETNRVNDYARSDGGHWIPWAYETGFTPNEYGELFTFAWLYLRTLVHWVVGGTGGDSKILAQFAELDSSVMNTLGSPTVSATNGKYIQMAINAVKEKIRLRLSGTNRVFIQNLTVALSEKAKTRPNSL